jgi:hypothetical protein
MSQPLQTNATDSTPTTDIKVQVANAPFDDLSADIILRSLKSNIDFYVFKMFLSYASPFFNSMFTLPQERGNQETKDGLPVIQVEEDEQTLDWLLRCCYPSWHTQSAMKPAFESLVLALGASVKYEMKEVEKFIQADIFASPMMTREPLRAYAIAVRHRLVHVARLAAREMLRLPRIGGECISELDYIPASALHRLQVYHMLCSDAARTAAENPDTWSDLSDFVWSRCSSDCTWFRKLRASKWWIEYIIQAMAALGETPSGASVTRVDLMENTLIKATACVNCRERAFGDMRKFSEAFALEVDRVTGTVSILSIWKTTGRFIKLDRSSWR